jgi:hypothetical protein
MWRSDAGALLLGLASAACAGEAPSPVQDYPLTVWNRCSVSPEEPNFYELLHLYAHETTSFLGSPDLLMAPLAVDARIVVVVTSTDYVTVVRRRNTGEEMALTTSSPLNLSSPCFVLQVFDESFRLSEDLDACVPMDDGEPAADGAHDSGGGDPPPGD